MYIYLLDTVKRGADTVKSEVDTVNDTVFSLIIATPFTSTENSYSKEIVATVSVSFCFTSSHSVGISIFGIGSASASSK